MNNLSPLTERIDKGTAGGHEFERLLNQLLLSFADANRFEYEPAGGAGGDDGIDGLVRRGGVPGFDGPVAFQCKWLWDGIHKGAKARQVTDSLHRASAAFPDLRHYVLITPHDLTPAEKEWLLSLSPRPGLAVHHWGEARVESLLREHAPKLFARYYPHEAATARGNQANPNASFDPEAVRPYLEHLIELCRFVPLRGVRREEKSEQGDPQRAGEDPDRRLELERIFVELDTTTGVPKKHIQIRLEPQSQTARMVYSSRRDLKLPDNLTQLNG